MYEAPSIIELGSVGDVTQANIDGNFLDADYPVDTPKSDLTFSG
jgi:hypothetical protein